MLDVFFQPLVIGAIWNFDGKEFIELFTSWWVSNIEKKNVHCLNGIIESCWNLEFSDVVTLQSNTCWCLTEDMNLTVVIKCTLCFIIFGMKVA